MPIIALRPRIHAWPLLLAFGALAPCFTGCGSSSPGSSASTPAATPTPTVSAIAPASVTAGSSDFKLTVTGQNFLASSVIQINGISLTSVTISSTQIVATVPAADVSAVGTSSITVVDPSPLSLVSNSTPLAVTAVPPVIQNVSATTAIAGAGPLNIRISGENFVSGSIVDFGTTALATQFQDMNDLSATIPASLLATVGTFNLTVNNPAPDMATSAPVAFTVTPIPPPAIVSLSPTTVIAGASAVLLTVNGQSLPAGATIQFNGQAITTNSLAANLLSATIPDALIATAGAYPVTVLYPSMGSGQQTTAPATFTVTPLPAGMSIVNQTANDIVADPVRTLLYASVPSTASANGNSIVAIDPTSGTITKSVNAGSEPHHLAISADGQYLYVSLDGASSVKRFLLPALTEDFTVSLGADSFFGANTALDLAVSLTSPHVWAVTSGNLGVSPAAQQGIGVYDDSVLRGSPVGRNSPHGGFDFLAGLITWGADTTTLYADNNESTGFDLYSIPVTSSGLGTIIDYGDALPGFNNGHIRFDPGTGFIYGEDGYVVNPANGHAVGQFAFSGPMTTDSALHAAFFIGNGFSSTAAGTLASFDLNLFTPLNTLVFPNVIGSPVRLVRWGTSGLAFNSINSTYTGSATTESGKIFIYSGSFVKPN